MSGDESADTIPVFGVCEAELAGALVIDNRIAPVADFSLITGGQRGSAGLLVEGHRSGVSLDLDAALPATSL